MLDERAAAGARFNSDVAGTFAGLIAGARRERARADPQIAEGGAGLRHETPLYVFIAMTAVACAEGRSQPVSFLGRKC